MPGRCRWWRCRHDIVPAGTFPPVSSPVGGLLPHPRRHGKPLGGLDAIVVHVSRSDGRRHGAQDGQHPVAGDLAQAPHLQRPEHHPHLRRRGGAAGRQQAGPLVCPCVLEPLGEALLQCRGARGHRASFTRARSFAMLRGALLPAARPPQCPQHGMHRASCSSPCWCSSALLKRCCLWRIALVRAGEAGRDQHCHRPTTQLMPRRAWTR